MYLAKFYVQAFFPVSNEILNDDYFENRYRNLGINLNGISTFIGIKPGYELLCWFGRVLVKSSIDRERGESYS